MSKNEKIVCKENLKEDGGDFFFILMNIKNSFFMFMVNLMFMIIDCFL